MKTSNGFCITIAWWCVVFALLSMPANAGFVLTVRNETNRLVNGVYEVDVYFQSDGGQPTTIKNILVGLQIAPGNGFSVGSITGVQFVGVQNAAVDPLFANPTIEPPDIPPPGLTMFTAIGTSSAISAPQAPTRAFTVLLQSTLSTNVDVKVELDIALYQPNTALENPIEFETFGASGNAFTVVGVPEPATYLMSSVGLAGAWLARRRNKRALVKSERAV